MKKAPFQFPLKRQLHKQLHQCVLELIAAYPNSPAVESVPAFEVKFAPPLKGDFTTNLAFSLSKRLRKAPLALAKILAKELLKKTAPSFVEAAWVEAPGFLNVRLALQQKTQVVKAILARHNPLAKQGQGEKILLEYVSANPTGPLHVGHGRWAVVGSVLATLLRYTGYEVYQEFYVNDAGKQITKFRESIAALQSGAAPPADGYQGDYLMTLAKQPGDAVALMLEQQKDTLSKLAVHFDNFFHETTLTPLLPDTLAFLKENGLTKEEQGALWFLSTKEGDDKDRVLIKSDGSPTYFLPDIVYHKKKVERGYYTLINLLGADHYGYKKRIESAVKLVSKAKAKLRCLIGQLVSFTRRGRAVKMSKRAGELVELQAILDEIGKDAVRYFFSSRPLDSKLVLDLEAIKEKKLSNPLFYIQYAHARLCSLFENAKKQHILFEPEAFEKFDYVLLWDLEKKRANNTGNTLQELWKQIACFEEELWQSVACYEIHHLNNYLYALAEKLHHWYNETVFLTAGSAADLQRSEQLLYFLAAIKNRLATGLQLLGIKAVERM